ncbi:MAG: trypsin-like peptidase domain-containing protein [Anaerolineae bacterium]
MSKRNLRCILLSALVVLSLTLPSCNIFTWPSRLVDEVEELATRVAPEVVEIKKPAVKTVVVEKEVPVEVTRIVEVEKEVLVTPTLVPPSTLSQLDVESQILTEVYRKVNPSVVNIRTDQAEGSGFVWDTEGHIVTNDHVVQGARDVLVTFADGVSLPATVIGEDPDSDLAVVEVDPRLHELRPVELGDVDEVDVGDRAIAIGNPFGLEGTLTQGIISAKGRSIPALTSFAIPEALQTDAAINPGNSGGPLLDSQGQVIGVNAQIETGSSLVQANTGIGFAIPVNIAKRVVPALIAEGYYDHAWLGISGQTYSPAWADALGFPEEARGAYVMYVEPGGPSDEAGLQAGTRQTDVLLGFDFGQQVYLAAGGDLIVAVDDQPVEKFDDLLVYLERYASPGDPVELTVLRGDGRQQVIPVTLGKRSQHTR